MEGKKRRIPLYQRLEEGARELFAELDAYESCMKEGHSPTGSACIDCLRARGIR